MKPLYLAFLLFMSLVLSGCDPEQTLIIKAANKPGVSVTIYAPKKAYGYVNIYDSTRFEKTVVCIPDPARPSKLDTSFNYSFGVWAASEIDSFASFTDSIIINGSKTREILKSKKEITDYCLHHRSGFAGSVLTIEAK